MVVVPALPQIRQPFPDVCMALTMIWYLTDGNERTGATWIVPGPCQLCRQQCFFSHIAVAERRGCGMPDMGRRQARTETTGTHAVRLSPHAE